MTATTPAAAGTTERATSRTPAPTRGAGISDDAKARFEQNLGNTRNEAATRTALAIAKLIAPDAVICPQCRKPAPKGKFKIHPDGGWKHFSSEGCSGDAVKVLQLVGIPTGDAVRALNGMPTRTEIEIPDDIAELAARFVGTKSRISLEVFNGVLVYGRKTGGIEAAQEFYGTWHIDPTVVEQSGAVLIRDPKHFREAILARFGPEKLIECGLFTQTQYGPYSLISDAFPVVEPHRHPATGDVLYMQLRGSHAQHQRYLEHKADPQRYEYKGREKFISLKGAPRAAQIGCRLDLIDKLPAGSTVYIVEGFKDALAGATLGLNTYGIPGVDFRPPPKICQLLARHNVFVTLDGDEAGIAGRDGKDRTDKDGNVIGHTEGLLAYLHRNGVTSAKAQDIGPRGLGLDVTDFLVAGHASGKFTPDGQQCACATCAKFRTDHPQWYAAS